MAKALTAETIAQLDAQQKRPVFLVEVMLDSATLRFAGANANITFPTGGNIYIAKAMEISKPSASLEGIINRLTIKFDNVSKDMMAYSDAEDFRGKRIKIKRIYLDNIADSTQYVEIFSGYMERPTEISRHWLSVPATNGKPLNRRAFALKYQRLCPWVFGGEECNTDGYGLLLTKSGTANSGSETTLTDNALTQVDNYWKYGKIFITKDGKTYNRHVIGFDSSSQTITFNIEVPFTIDNSCTYSVQRGCDHTWETCCGGLNYGPANDNRINYGGFLHIAPREGGRNIYSAPAPKPSNPTIRSR